ncbi:DUF3291 domain-containing protein [Pseudooceanicola spongiae]|uniref:DUF3291 domain-containing protein n=2 Tax=Pseudooceanicola spongiae TaxID=2613965 RepID=A0A7L9WPK5_9RHOB|nr:DUF3291 domain-containing protein [Pseudooceanicola spongiae]
MAMPIAAIGGLRVKAGLRRPEFFFHSLRSLLQARRAEGVIAAKVFPAENMFFSLSVWDSAASMKRFAMSGAHRRAMAASARVAVVFPFHIFDCATVPTPQEALQLWQARQRERES